MSKKTNLGGFSPQASYTDRASRENNSFCQSFKLHFIDGLASEGGC
jgi:hypothetical protein